MEYVEQKELTKIARDTFRIAGIEGSVTVVSPRAFVDGESDYCLYLISQNRSTRACVIGKSFTQARRSLGNPNLLLSQMKTAAR